MTCDSKTIIEIANEDQNLRRSVYFSEIEELFKKYEATILSVPLSGLSEDDKIVLKYDTIETNAFILPSFGLVPESNVDVVGVSPISIEENKTKYPNLWNRLSSIPFLSDTEVLDFINLNNTTIFSYPKFFLPENQERILVMYNTFFTPGGSIAQNSMGSFCSLVPNIFSKLAEIRAKYDDVLGYVKKTAEIFEKIKDIPAKVLVEQLRQELLRTVDRIIEDFKEKLAAITLGFLGEYLMAKHDINVYSVMDTYRKLKDKASSFTAKEIVENIKNKVSGLVTQAVSLFDLENFSIEEAQFLILRFCEFIGGINKFFTDLIDPIRTLENNFHSSFNRLKNSGNLASAIAIGAGGIRFDLPERMSNIDASFKIPRIDGRINSRKNREDDLRNQQGSEPPTATNTAIPMRQRSGIILPPTVQEINSVPNFEQAKSGYNGIRYNPGSISSALGRDGWEKVQTLEIVMLLRLAREWGSELVINSAYRSRPVGAATKSWHMSGQAFDVSMRGVAASERSRFIQLARNLGFGGIGRYSTFIHIDSGPVRSW